VGLLCGWFVCMYVCVCVCMCARVCVCKRSRVARVVYSFTMSLKNSKKRSTVCVYVCCAHTQVVCCCLWRLAGLFVCLFVGCCWLLFVAVVVVVIVVVAVFVVVVVFVVVAVVVCLFVRFLSVCHWYCLWLLCGCCGCSDTFSHLAPLP
jgi:hypothetical protein